MTTFVIHWGWFLALTWASALGMACGAAPGATGATATAAPPAAGPPAAGPPAAGPPVALAPGDLAITDVTVVPMTEDGELAHRTVVVRGDRILAVVPSAALRVPPDVTAIDGAGTWLMPGLADMHVHVFGDDQLTLFLAAGVTTIRNMYGSEQHLAWRGKIARGELLGPTIVTAGPLIDGDPPIWPGSTVLTNPADADRIVTDQKAAGYDFLKPYSRLSRPAYEALAAAGQRHGMQLAGHVPEAVGLDGVLAAHQRSIEHLDGYLLALVPDGTSLPESRPARLRVTLARLEPSRLPGVIDRTLAAGTWNCPTLVVLERFGALDDLPALRRRVAWLDKLPPAIVDGWDPKQDFRLQSYTALDFATIRAANAWRAKVLAALAAAGAPLLVGTDTGNPFVVPGASLHDEIELMIAAGVPRPRVLRAATADAARFLGTPGAFGVIAAGARADLMLVASDPLAVPLPLVPEGVVARGRYLARAELEARLADITARVTAPPPRDRWDGVPPLAGEGKPVHQVRYDIASGDKPVGEARLSLGGPSGKRVIVGQEVVEFGGRLVTSYRIAPDAVTLAMTSPYGSMQLDGHLEAGALVATGTGQGQKPLALREPVPPGGFLTGPDIAGSIAFADRLAGVKPGGKLQLVALGLTSFPAAAIATIRYDIERKPDDHGHRVFAVTTTQDGVSLAGELVLDSAGGVVSQRFGQPLNATFTRRP